MENRIYNFSAGPAIIPEEVLLGSTKRFVHASRSGNVNNGNQPSF